MTRRPAAGLLLALLGLVGCSVLRLERNLDPVSRDFLSKVRYLITRPERRVFVNLPPSERPAFVDEFWKKRDPDPETEENELKTEYFRRIDEANHLFTDGGEPGWLQDRGRIYILLGPPEQRITYPRGIDFYGKPTEIWYYGFFPITFIDFYWTGNYKYDPDNPIQLTEIMKTQLALKPQVIEERAPLEFEASAERTDGEAVRVRLEIPYTRIWMKSDEGALTTSLSATVAVDDAAGKRVLEEKRDVPLRLTEAELEKIIAGKLAIDVPVKLKRGKHILSVSLSNAADGSQAHRRIIFNR
jgi:GWxTD domain-containing protein